MNNISLFYSKSMRREVAMPNLLRVFILGYVSQRIQKADHQVVFVWNEDIKAYVD